MQRFAFASALFFACSSQASAQPAPPSAPPLQPAGNCAASSFDAEFPVTQLFSHDIADGPTLRFIARLSALPAKQQASFLRTASAPVQAVTPAVRGRIMSAATAHCLGEETAYRAGRALLMVVNRWNLDENDPQFLAVVAPMKLAVAALADRGALEISDVDAALAPFGARLADLQAPPQAGKCETADVDATARQIPEVHYPDAARDTRTTGDIRVKVALDSQGFVRSVSPQSQKGDGPRLDELTKMTLYTAAATTYTPEIVHCEPVNSTYMFRAQYTAK